MEPMVDWPRPRELGRPHLRELGHARLVAHGEQRLLGGAPRAPRRGARDALRAGAGGRPGARGGGARGEARAQRGHRGAATGGVVCSGACAFTCICSATPVGFLCWAGQTSSSARAGWLTALPLASGCREAWTLDSAVGPRRDTCAAEAKRQSRARRTPRRLWTPCCSIAPSEARV